MFRKFIPLVLFLLVSHLAWSQQYNYRFHSYDEEDGLPSQEINSIIEDSYGFLWIGTNGGLCRFDAYEFKTFPLTKNDSLTDSAIRINVLLAVSDSIILVGADEGLFSFNIDTEESILLADTLYVEALEKTNNLLYVGTDQGVVKHNLTSKTSEQLTLSAGEKVPGVFQLLVDSKERLWIATIGQGLIKYENNRITQYNTANNSGISSDVLRDLVELPDGKIAIGTEDDGLNILNPETEEFVNFTRKDNDKYSLSSSSAYSLLVDDLDQLWIGTWAHGLNLLDKKSQNVFHRFTANNDDPYSIPNNFIKCLYQSSDGTIWMGSAGDGLGRFHANEQKIIRFRHDNSDENSITTNNVKSVYEDEKGNIWIGTSQSGLNKYTPSEDKFKTYLASDGTRDAMARGTIWSISPGKDNALWLGTSRGIGKLNTQTEEIEFIAPSKEGLLGNNVLKVLDDGQGNLWAGSWYGGLNKMNIATGKFEQYTHNPENPSSIASNNVNDIHQASNGSIWVATSSSLSKLLNDGKSFKNFPYITLMIAEDNEQNLWLSTSKGLAKLIHGTDSLYFFTNRDGLTTTKVSSILIAETGNLWLGSDTGIDIYHPEKGLLKHLDRNDGLAGNSCLSRACFKSKSGNFYFGGSEGLSLIDPEKIDFVRTKPKLQYTGLLLFNEPVGISDSTFLYKGVHAQDRVIFNYKDYIFAFEFAALDFNRSEQVNYQYQLTGFDNAWISTSAKNRKAVYTNVPPGDYTLKVRAEAFGQVPMVENAIKISITPPWWETWWAQSLFYGMLLLVIVAIFQIRVAVIKKQKRVLEQQVLYRTAEIENQKEEIEQQASQLQLLNEQKDKLFSMVSHDMRNPLATLKGTVMLLDPKILREEDLANIKKDIGDKIEGLSAVIINLLDWSKSQLSGETTVPEPFNLKVIGQQMLELFADPAQKKGIEVLNNFPKEIRLFADVNQVRTIFRNLIGNALKFSESGDTIELNVEIDNDMAIIEVKDTGLGMDQNKINSLFSLETNISTPGTSGEKGVGLGTLLIKEFVEKNSGKVWVDSKEGQGTSVFFTLKLFNEELS